MPDTFLLHAQRSGPSARMLAERLEIPCGTSVPERRLDFLIRWGSANRIPFRPTIRTFNFRNAVALNSDKLRAMRTIAHYNVPVPDHSANFDTIGIPALGRDTSHRGGTDIVEYFRPGDFNERGPAAFYVRYIPKRAEFRIHVAFGRIIKISQKIRTEDDGNHYVAWNYNNGYTFRDPEVRDGRFAFAISAVEALGLDFGAVDCIIGTDERLYILEVNTAPGLIDTTADAYADAIRENIARFTVGE